MPKFTSLASALRAGYTAYDRNANGILVRVRTKNGWTMGIVTAR